MTRTEEVAALAALSLTIDEAIVLAQRLLEQYATQGDRAPEIQDCLAALRHAAEWLALRNERP